MTTIAPLQVGQHTIGSGHPCYVIAEAGSNHNGDLQTALRLIDVAVDAGADAVKFQVFTAAHLYSPKAGTSDYLGDTTPIYDIIAKMEMPAAWLPQLHGYCAQKGIDFLCSAFDEQSVDLVDPYVPMWKCASYEMTHTPLLRHMASKGKPLLISTGAADLDEIGTMVAVLRDIYGDAPPPAILLQCTASYPTPPQSAHVRVVATLHAAFGMHAGLSDHTRDPIAAPAAAVALGAVVVEKHYTLSNRLPGPDHKFALEPHELAAMVRQIRATELALGSGRKVPDEAEAELRHFARRSIFATQPIAAGTAFDTDNLRVLRRGKLATGLDPVHFAAILGRTALTEVAADTPIEASHVAGGADLLANPVQLRRARLGDAELVWQWNNDPTARAVSLNPTAIPWADHVRWFAQRLDDPQTRMWIVVAQDSEVGVIRIDGAARISAAMAADLRGRGLGRVALRLACQRFCGETGQRAVHATILAGNTASQRAFAAAGFVQANADDSPDHSVGYWTWQRQ